ncbi:hypothetical protein KKG46_04390 [Patescibacteria group bacterium]|nr:hypothetical protein [Patescibacteria group bacterium]
MSEFFETNFMYRFAGHKDEVLICKHIKELLLQIYNVFCIRSVDRYAFDVFDEAVQGTEACFGGELSVDVLELYYKLGVILISIREDDLGYTCHYLHHVYKNQSVSNFPPCRAVINHREKELKRLVPVVELVSGIWDMDTSDELKALAQ